MNEPITVMLDETPWVLINQSCKALGINGYGQTQRAKRIDPGSTQIIMVSTPSGGKRTMVCTLDLWSRLRGGAHSGRYSSSRAGHVYVIELSSGWIKVGYTNDVARRMRQYRADARVYGGNVLGSWSSDPLVDARSAEEGLIAWCTERSTDRLRKEFFKGPSYEDAVAFGRTIVKGNRSHVRPVRPVRPV